MSTDEAYFIYTRMYGKTKYFHTDLQMVPLNSSSTMPQSYLGCVYEGGHQDTGDSGMEQVEDTISKYINMNKQLTMGCGSTKKNYD